MNSNTIDLKVNDIGGADTLLVRRWTRRGTFPGDGCVVGDRMGGAVVDVEYVGDITPRPPQGAHPPIELGPGR